MDFNSATRIIAPFTAKWETFQANPYYDVNGWAIGFGNHYYTDGTTVDETDPPISQSDAYDLMNFYLAQNANAIIPQLTVTQNNNQLAALIDVRYRYGSIPDLVNLINSGADPQTVANAIAAKDNNGTEVDRANGEAAIYIQADPAGAAVPLLVFVAGLVMTMAIVKGS